MEYVQKEGWYKDSYVFVRWSWRMCWWWAARVSTMTSGDRALRRQSRCRSEVVRSFRSPLASLGVVHPARFKSRNIYNAVPLPPHITGTARGLICIRTVRRVEDD